VFLTEVLQEFTQPKKFASHLEAPASTDYRQQFDDFLNQQIALQHQSPSKFSHTPTPQFTEPTPKPVSSANDSKDTDSIDYSALDEVTNDELNDINLINQTKYTKGIISLNK